jgi:type II secretory pathway component PulF
MSAAAPFLQANDADRQAMHDVDVVLPRRRTAGATSVALARDTATLLRVGVSLVEALRTAHVQMPRRLQTPVENVIRDVEAGRSFSSAVDAHLRQHFSAADVAVIRAAESSGTLADALDHIASLRDRLLQLKDRVLASLAYPALVFVMTVGVTLFLMTVVVPQLSAVLEDAGADLPWITRGVQACSTFTLDYGLIVLGIAAALAIVGRFALRGEKTRLLLHRQLLRLPVIGAMTRQQAMLPACRTLATLLRAGIPLTTAMDLAADGCGNLALAKALRTASAGVEHGRDAGPSLRDTLVFTPMELQVFTIGQESGELPATLDRLADAYDRSLDTSSRRLAAVVEPIAIVVLVIVIGTVALATILPMLEVARAI